MIAGKIVIPTFDGTSPIQEGVNFTVELNPYVEVTVTIADMLLPWGRWKFVFDTLTEKSNGSIVKLTAAVWIRTPSVASSVIEYVPIDMS